MGVKGLITASSLFEISMTHLEFVKDITGTEYEQNFGKVIENHKKLRSNVHLIFHHLHTYLPSNETP